MEKQTSLSDMPLASGANDLGTEKYVKGLISFIERSAAPITIALQGEWGSGKTSLMNRLHERLCGEGASFIGISVNTWEYSMLSTPEVAVIKILDYLITALSANNPEPSKKFNKYLSTVKNIVFRAAREGGKILAGDIGAMAIEALVGSNIDDKIQDNDVSLSELRTDLNKAIADSLANNHKQGIIVFVDDLDRLNPPLAVEILELLKNVFTLDNCIFVLAIDYDVVVKGLKPKFGELTEKNEREFRSFFDKIIQVPFSLPVNSYRPMNFILDALEKIGYLTAYESAHPEIQSSFYKIIEATVGKNPRSIKRLINTLSLLDCIDKSDDVNTNRKTTVDDKLLNFTIVAIQICYPKIYRMLVKEPSFTSWDTQFATKMGIEYAPDNNVSDTESEWEDVLEAACTADAYLTQHHNDINDLLNLIIKIAGKDEQDENGVLGLKIKHILDKSSVTGIDTEAKGRQLDRQEKKELIAKIYSKLWDRMRDRRPDIEPKIKNNTGNGGAHFYINKDTYYEVTLMPGDVTADNKISLAVFLRTQVHRPERLIGKTFDDIMNERPITEGLEAYDRILMPLLKDKAWFLQGRTIDNQQFDSYIEEVRYLHDHGHMSGDIFHCITYDISLGKMSLFEADEIIDTMATIIIAGYDLRYALKDLK